VNRSELSTITEFIVDARTDALQAAKSSDRLGLTTAHMRLMLAASALDDSLEAIHNADTAAELLEGIGT
jgi:hypothetical protein